MEAQFYRKPPQRSWFANLAKRAFKNRRRTTLVFISIILVSYIFFNNRGVVARIRLEMQRLELMKSVQAAEQETKRLQAYIKALEGDKKTIEKVARERYGMAREGETVYRVKKD